MKVKTTWEYSKETETKVIIHTAHQIATYFYQINGFLVLPEGKNNYLPNSVIFPDLEYLSIPRFWDKAGKASVGCFDYPGGLEEKVSGLLSVDEKNKFEMVKGQWEKASNELFDSLSHLVPEKTKELGKITIYPSSFGTICSYGDFNDGSLEMFLRKDATLANIVEMIVSSFAWKDLVDGLGATWSEVEVVSDWLISNTKIAGIVKKHSKSEFIPTLPSTRGLQASPANKESERYLEKLGFVLDKYSLLKKIENKIYLKGKKMVGLNKLQVDALGRLIDDKELSSNDLASIMFEKDSDYSLYAMSKFMQRLRDKLEKYGVTGSVIQTVRNYGYVLNQ